MNNDLNFSPSNVRLCVAFTVVVYLFSIHEFFRLQDFVQFLFYFCLVFFFNVFLIVGCGGIPEELYCDDFRLTKSVLETERKFSKTIFDFVTFVHFAEIVLLSLMLL